jgi:hypothetical protein
LPSIGPLEELLELNREILEAEHALKNAKFWRRVIRFMFIFVPVSVVGIYIAIVVSWRKFDVAPFTWPVALAVIASVVFVINSTAGKKVRGGEFGVAEVGSISLDLAILNERKRLRAAALSLEPVQRRSIYKDDTAKDLLGLRKSTRYYRRIHNILQALVIVGSIVTSTVSGLLIDATSWGILVAASGFVVALATGFSGYYKFRERSFYLQQTADSIEQEWNAVELGIGRYVEMNQIQALKEFAIEVERLKGEQQKREQNLDQPPENTARATNG